MKRAKSDSDALIKEKLSQSLCFQFHVCWKTCKYRSKYFKTILMNRFRWHIILQGKLRQSLCFLSHVKNCWKAKLKKKKADKELKLDLILAGIRPLKWELPL